MVRFYIVPAIIVNGRRGPKYFAFRGNTTPLMPDTVNWEARDYGLEPSMIIAADLTDPQDVSLTGNADVIKFNDNLDTQVGANATSFQTAVEAINLPTGPIPATTTYRQLLRGFTGIFMLAQCAQGKGVSLFGAGATITTQFGALPQGSQDAITTCAPLLGFSTVGLVATTTIRQMYVSIANQASPTTMLGTAI